MNSPMTKKISPAPEKSNGGASTKLAVGILSSVISLWIICSKHATRTSKKIAPKKMMATISHKAIHFRQKKNGESKKDDGEDGGVWRRTILMGDKCEPLDFSGVIYYDSEGNKLSEVPMRSPRASPLPSYAYKSEKEKSRLGW
ncbi:hypothetical protein POM88_038196 [Heracleum sosnowskyi]|uniref:Transmembrane protein n=1 Tax=Heracleum sosnowskyi TaxID=360622 RepID=A0AAD8HSV9_9APIA|nr:hypothetical protein POM88_038196 [Heracleum sosnowskyi]